MTNIEVVAPYAIIDYTWALLQANTGMRPEHYSNRVPVIPSSQQPEFTDSNRPFLVYAWSEEPSYDPYAMRSGQIAYAVYAPTDREIGKIVNTLAVDLGRFDESAETVNEWKANKVYRGIRFTSFSVGIIEGPSPENQEGGRSSGVVMIRYGYVAEYNILPAL